jgi:hypothetical protein
MRNSSENGCDIMGDPINPEKSDERDTVEAEKKEEKEEENRPKDRGWNGGMPG